MLRKEITILNFSGLHARPAAALVKLTSKFHDTKILLQKDGLEVNAKSIMGVMTLAAEKGSKLLIIVNGNDENEALNQIIKLIENKFAEEN